MRRTNIQHLVSETQGATDGYLKSAHHSPLRRPVDYWSIGMGLACLVLVLQAFLANAQDKAPAKPTGEKFLAESARLTFVEKRDLTFDRAGVLEFVQEDGESVTAGQIVARFLNAREKAALQVAQAKVVNKAEIIASQRQAELAEIKAKATQKAYDEWRAAKDQEIAKLKAAGSPIPPKLLENLYPQSTLDEGWKSHEAAVAEIGRYEKEHAVNEKGIEQAQADLAMTEIKAPLAGQVTRVYKRSGEGVQAGEKVLQVISTQRIRATVEVPVSVASRLQKGMPVTVIIQQPDETSAIKPQRYAVPLKAIDPSVIPGAQKVTIWAEIDNSDGKLREGLTSAIEITWDAPAVAPAAVK